MQVFHHYEIKTRDDGSLWELGRGAMGVNYLAVDTLLDREVALKVVNSASLGSEVAQMRFQREARAAARINHENVAQVYQFGIEGDQFFYAMEFIRGRTVEQALCEDGRMAPAAAVKIAIQVCLALSAAEREGLVHRDIKPANLMLTEHEGDVRVKVIDFGLAKASDGNPTDATLTIAGFVGTPVFASPEQLQELPLDTRSDLYSLGVTLWFMLSGNPPFTGTFASIVVQHLHEPVPLERLPGLPAPLAAVLQKSMEKDPARRFQSPREMREALEGCLPALRDGAAVQISGPQTATIGPSESGTLAPPLPTQAGDPPPPRSKRNLIFALLLLVALLVLVAGGVLLVGKLGRNLPVVQDSEAPVIAETKPAGEVVTSTPTPPDPTPEPEPTAEPTPDPASVAELELDRARLDEEQGNLNTAIARYLKVREILPSDARADVKLNQIFADLDRQRRETDMAAPLPESLAKLGQEAAVANIPMAMLFLANAELSTRPAVAAYWYEKAGDIPQALNQLGLLYSEGRGAGPTDPERSIQLFEKSAELGDRSGKLYLADALRQEDGLFARFYNPTRAVQLLREAASLGEPRAMRLLGFHYDKGLGVGRSDNAALQWYEKAWENGLTRAAADLGVFHMQGRGVPANPAKAVGFFAAGAAAKEPHAMHFYALCLTEGLGVAKDEAAARELFAAAAQAGNADARAECKKRGIPFDTSGL